MHMYYKKHLQVLCVTFGGLRCSYILQKVIARKAKAFDGDPVPESFLQPQLPTNDPITQEATLISKEDIKYKKKLGEGAHGAVFEGTWSNKHGSVSGREGGREGGSNWFCSTTPGHEMCFRTRHTFAKSCFSLFFWDIQAICHTLILG